jgi:hypothetical protein
MLRYSLRTLLIAVALAGLLLGGRVEYLRRQARFHADEALKSAATAGGFGDYLYHDEFAKNYQGAISRPWSMVKAPPPAVRGDK